MTCALPAGSPPPACPRRAGRRAGSSRPPGRAALLGEARLAAGVEGGPLVGHQVCGVDGEVVAPADHPVVDGAGGVAGVGAGDLPLRGEVVRLPLIATFACRTSPPGTSCRSPGVDPLRLGGDVERQLALRGRERDLAAGGDGGPLVGLHVEVGEDQVVPLARHPVVGLAGAVALVGAEDLPLRGEVVELSLDPEVPLADQGERPLRIDRLGVEPLHLRGEVHADDPHRGEDVPRRRGPRRARVSARRSAASRACRRNGRRPRRAASWDPCRSPAPGGRPRSRRPG